MPEGEPSIGETPDVPYPEVGAMLRDPRQVMIKLIDDPLLGAPPDLCAYIKSALCGNTSTNYLRELRTIAFEKKIYSPPRGIVDEPPLLPVADEGGPLETMIAAALVHEWHRMADSEPLEPDYELHLACLLAEISHGQGFIARTVHAAILTKGMRPIVSAIRHIRGKSQEFEMTRTMSIAAWICNLAIECEEDDYMQKGLFDQFHIFFRTVNKERMDDPESFVDCCSVHPPAVILQLLKTEEENNPQGFMHIIDEIAARMLDAEEIPVTWADAHALMKETDDDTMMERWKAFAACRPYCEDKHIADLVAKAIEKDLAINQLRMPVVAVETGRQEFRTLVADVLRMYEESRSAADRALQRMEETAGEGADLSPGAPHIQVTFADQTPAFAGRWKTIGKMIQKLKDKEWHVVGADLARIAKTVTAQKPDIVEPCDAVEDFIQDGDDRKTDDPQEILQAVLDEAKTHPNVAQAFLCELMQCLSSGDSLRAAEAVIKGFNTIARIRQVDGDALLRDVIDCKTLRETREALLKECEISDADAKEAIKRKKAIRAQRQLCALDKEILARAARAVVQYPYAAQTADGKPLSSYEAGFPSRISSDRQLNCFGGPWVLAAMLLQSGIPYENLWHCNVYEDSRLEVRGTHGSLLMATYDKVLTVADVVGGSLSSPLEPEFCETEEQRTQLAVLLNRSHGRAVTVGIKPEWADPLDLPKRMQILPLFQGLAASHALHTGLSLMEESKHAEAICILDIGLQFNPMDVDLLYYRGYMELAEGRTATARPFFAMALDIYPMHILSLCGLGDIEAREGNSERARELLEKALEDEFPVWGDKAGKVKARARTLLSLLEQKPSTLPEKKEGC